MAESDSRFAELAQEILGAQMAAKLVQEIWDSATDERKTEMADAILKVCKARIERKEWGIEREVDRRINEVATERATQLVEERMEEILEKVDQAFQKRYEKTIQAAASKVLAQSAELTSDLLCTKMKSEARTLATRYRQGLA